MNLHIRRYIRRLTAVTLLIVGFAHTLAAQDKPLVVDSLMTADSLAVSKELPNEPAPKIPVHIGILANRPAHKFLNNLAIKTNLLFYAILMPNIEVEYKFAEKWSAAFEAQAAWYAKKQPHKVYRIASYTPEVRYWIINKSYWHGLYVGAFFGYGPYDLSNGRHGNEGEGLMAGVSAGYMWEISRVFSLEAGIGLGYLRAQNKEYAPVDDHFLYQQSKTFNYFGPLRLKLSLVWRLQSLFN